jgi:hypothetical protein
MVGVGTIGRTGAKHKSKLPARLPNMHNKRRLTIADNSDWVRSFGPSCADRNRTKRISCFVTLAQGLVPQVPSGIVTAHHKQFVASLQPRVVRVDEIDIDQPVPSVGLGHLVEVIECRLSLATQVGYSKNMRLQCCIRHRNV